MPMRTRIVIIICFLFWNTECNAFSFKSITDQITNVKSNLTQDEQQQNHFQQQLKPIEIALGEKNQEIHRINQAELNERFLLNKLSKEQLRVQTDLAHQQTLLGEQVRAAYLLGQPNEIKIIFNQENPNTLNRHLYYYQKLMQNHLALMNDIQNSITKITNTVKTISDHQAILKKLLADKQTEQQSLQTLISTRQELLAHLNRKIESEEAELNDLLIQLKSQPITLEQPFLSLRGKLSWPVDGTMTAHYGSKVDNSSLPLSGVVLKAPAGTPVHAIAAGKVVFANWLRGFGLLVIIDHGNGYMSLYARNQSLNKKTGDTVKTNETIATMGDSGGFTTSSLYFEIRQNGRPINPQSWCA